MDALHTLQSLFKRFPGIGERQAMRFAYFIATVDERYVKELSEAITRIQTTVQRCTRCYALSQKIVNGVCDVCRDTTRDTTLVLVIEKDADREKFIQSKTYNGTYFVLGGLAPMIDKDITRSPIRLRELSTLISKEQPKGLREVVLALSATPDGDRTEALLITHLKKDFEGKIQFSVLGKGLSTGTEIEYSDAETLSAALRSRLQS